MAMISPQVKALFEDHKSNFKYFALATSSKEGVPNVVPIGFLWVANDKEIWVIDNYMNKTYANIKENPVAAVYAIGGGGGREDTNAYRSRVPSGTSISATTIRPPSRWHMLRIPHSLRRVS